MVFQYLSDLHFEQPANRAYLRSNPLRPVADTLLIAGDLMPLNCIDRFSNFLDFLSSNWKSVIWVPGNHEFYGHDLSEFEAPRIENIRQNILLCHRSSVQIHDIKVLGCTLWSCIDKNNQPLIERSLQDFNKINWKNRRLTVEDYNSMHKKDLEFLKESNIDSSTIVISHHVPTLENYPKKYEGSSLNQAFVSDNSAVIKTSMSPYWIYGHHHANTQSFKLGQTMVMTNQLGYVAAEEHFKFNGSSTFTI